jgi:trigger factor
MNRLRREVGEKLIAAHAESSSRSRMVEERSPRCWRARPSEQAKSQGQKDRAPRTRLPAAAKQARHRGDAGGRARAPQQHPGSTTRASNETLRHIASTYEEPQQVIDLYRNDPQLMQGLQNRVVEEQVIDWIAERADLRPGAELPGSDRSGQ